MVLNCNTSVDCYFVTGSNVTIKWSVIYLTRCKCVIVELFNSVYRTHTVMSLTQYILLKYANDGRDKGAVSNIVSKYLLDCVDKKG